jgi:hypothetical protein
MGIRLFCCTKIRLVIRDIIVSLLAGSDRPFEWLKTRTRRYWLTIVSFWKDAIIGTDSSYKLHSIEKCKLVAAYARSPIKSFPFRHLTCECTTQSLLTYSVQKHLFTKFIGTLKHLLSWTITNRNTKYMSQIYKFTSHITCYGYGNVNLK